METRMPKAVDTTFKGEPNPYRYKVEIAKTASGKDTVLVRVYSDDGEEALREALELREKALSELGEES